MSKWMTTLLLLCLIVSLTAGQNLVRTFRDKAGNLVDEFTIPDVPVSQRISGPVAVPTRSAVILPDVPAFDWSHGCAATSAAMLAGYWDRHKFDNMYAGPTNGGVMPMNNSVWGAGNCPLSATKTGLDNLTTDGHVNRFYVAYESSGNDPFGTGDPTGTYSGCTADYMGTNQDWWSNSDGSTRIYTYNTLGAPLVNFIEPESYTPRRRDIIRGLRLFFESRGYVVTNNYNQKIDGYNGITGGFTFANYMASIDAGVPVFIHVTGHTMLGVGYDSATNTVYLHNTWDYDTHSMIWGDSYSGMQHFAVSVITLAPATISSSPSSFTQALETNHTASQNLTISNPGAQTLNYTCTGGSWLTINGSSSYTSSIAVGGEAQVISVGFNSAGLSVGQYTSAITVTSNSATNPSYTIPVTFDVTAPVPIVITAPTTGDVWQGGSQYSINWNYSSTGTYVVLAYSTNGGTGWTLVDNLVTVSGTNSYSWTAPNVSSTNFMIKLIDSVSPFYAAISNAFTVSSPPSAARIKFPGNNAPSASIDTDLEWFAPLSGIATGYKVYLGTDNPPTNLVNGTTQTGLSYLIETLAYATTYYWKIVPYNASGDTPNCPVWNFTTCDQIVVATEPILTDVGFVVPSVTIPDVEGYVGLHVTANYMPEIPGFSNIGLQLILEPINLSLQGRSINLHHDLRFAPEQIAYRILPSATYSYITPSSPIVTLWNSSDITITLPNGKAAGDVEVLFPSDSDETLSIELSSFTATATFNSTMVRLNWATQSETNHLGYNVLRSETNQLAAGIRVNQNVITDGEHLGTSTNYVYTDAEVIANQTYYYWLQSLELDGSFEMFGPISITMSGQTTPDVTAITTMGNAYPNPFRTGTSTSIEVSVKEGETGTLKICNARGQVVHSYIVKPGLNKLTWNAKGCASGIYFQKLSTPSTNIVKKLVIIR